MESIKAPPLGKQVAALMRQGIIEGEFPPGTTFLQGDLADRYGVSRIPIREALQILEHEGLVVVQPNRRVMVATLTTEEIEDDYSVRALIEGEAARRAAALSDREATVAQLRKAHAEASAAHDADDVVGLLQVFRDFHLAIWKASQSRQLLTLAEQLWRGLAPHTPAFLPKQYEHSTAEHERIIETLAAGDPGAAGEEMASHILRTCRDLVAYRQATGEPTAVSRDGAGGQHG